MNITDRTKNYPCPTCHEPLVAAVGDGPDGQPVLWWCTTESCEESKFDPREIELTEGSATAVIVDEDPTPAPDVDSDSEDEAETDDSSTSTSASTSPTTSPTETTSSAAPPSSSPSLATKAAALDFNKIPAPKEALKRQMALVSIGFRTARQFLMYGPPGTGKSTVAAIHDLGGRTIHAITLTPETPMFEIRGTQTVKDGTVVWQDGPGIAAWRVGGRLILDEIDQAGPDIMSFLHALLDDKMAAEKKGYTLPSGETVFPHPNFQVICTMNGTPERLPPAIASRLSRRVNVIHPMPEIVQAIDEDLRAPALNAIIDGKTGAREWLNLCDTRAKLINEESWKKEAAHEAAGLLVFGNNWKEMVGDIKIGTAPDPK